MNPYQLMYRVGFSPWDRTPGPAILGSVLDGPDGPPAGRALDVGCGTGRDAVFLAKRGWQVTGVDAVEKALDKARRRAAKEGVEVQLVRGDVSDLPGLGLEPGYTLLYDIGCLHGLPDSARATAAGALTELAAPGAVFVLLAMRHGRRLVLPRGMEEAEVVALFGDAWELVDVYALEDPGMPPPIRRARPTVYRLTRSSTPH